MNWVFYLGEKLLSAENNLQYKCTDFHNLRGNSDISISYKLHMDFNEGGLSCTAPF